MGTTPAGRRSSRAVHRVSEPINLGGLRWLVKKCEGMPDTARVSVKEHKDHAPIDWDEASIEVSGGILE